jgi:hypothetical protein
MLASLRAGAPVGAGEWLQYSPPGNSTLVGGTVMVHMDPGSVSTNASPVAALYEPLPLYDSNDVFYQCTPGVNGCHGFTGQIALPANKAGTLSLGATCGGAAGYTCGLGVGAQVYWADLLLQNNSIPTASGFSGSLLQPGAHGTATLQFTANDPGGPGLYTVVAQVDGQTLSSSTPNGNQGRCASVGTSNGALLFDYQQPCLQSEQVNLAIPTGGLSDGEHELRVLLADAASNTSTVLDQTISTSNRTTISSALDSPLLAGPGAVHYAFRLDPQSQKLLAGVRRRYTASGLELSGTLLTAAGAPAPGVGVAVLAGSADGALGRLAQTSTDGAGRFQLSIPRGPSRQLQLIAGASMVSLQESVAPDVHLHVRALPGARLLFTGSVQISPLGPPRPLVIIYVLRPTGWKPAGATGPVGAHGRFRFVVQSSPLSVGYPFRFRAVTPPATLWSGASSPTRTATVR